MCPQSSRNATVIRLKTTNQPVYSVVCKTLGSIICDNIMHHLVQNQLLTKHQRGFVKGRSCVTQILGYTRSLLWTEALDNGSNIDSVYLIFAKAFDSVPHKCLLIKMKSFGITGKYGPGSRISSRQESSM